MKPISYVMLTEYWKSWHRKRMVNALKIIQKNGWYCCHFLLNETCPVSQVLCPVPQALSRAQVLRIDSVIRMC